MEEQLREDFKAAMIKHQDIPTNSWSLTKEKYAKIIQRLLLLESDKSIKKLHSDYRLLHRFRLGTIVNDNEETVERLFHKQSGKEFIATEDIFDTIYETHIQSRHGGRCKMKKILRQKYANITSKQIMILRQLCPQCRNLKTKAVSASSKPDINVCDQYSTAQVSIILDPNLKAEPHHYYIMLLIN